MNAETTTVRIPTPLRKYTGGAAEVRVTGSSVGDALADLRRRYGDLGRMLFTETGELRPFVNVFAGRHNVRTGRGLDTPLRPGEDISIIPAVAGGRS